MNPSGISVVIPAFNEEKFLPPTLASIHAAADLFAREFQLPWEVIVVNNLSTDGTVAVAKSLAARVVDYGERNIAGVRNTGVRAANYNLVVTVDADNSVPPNAFVEMWKAMLTGRYVGGGVRVGVQSEVKIIKVLVFMIDRAILYGAGLSAGMFFFWKADGLAIGGFPESYLVGEDTVFAAMLRNEGKKRGLRFCNLHSVKLMTADRKKVTAKSALYTCWQVFRQLRGHKVTREELHFWYNPDR